MKMVVFRTKECAPIADTSIITMMEEIMNELLKDMLFELQSEIIAGAPFFVFIAALWAVMTIMVFGI